MTVDEELQVADRALVQAVSAGDAKAAAALLDDDFSWVDGNGRLMGKRDIATTLPRPLLHEAGRMAVIYRYGDVAHTTCGRDQIYLLRIWVRRAQGWRLLIFASGAARAAWAGSQGLAQPRPHAALPAAQQRRARLSRRLAAAGDRRDDT